MLGKHGGDLGPEVRGVEQVFDVRTVHTEDVRDAVRAELLDDKFDHPCVPHSDHHLFVSRNARPWV